MTASPDDPASSRRSHETDAWVGVVLAAGRGERMRSTLPKVLHPVAGRPMVRHVLLALQPLVSRIVVVVPPDVPDIAAAVADLAAAVPQGADRGTAAALEAARDAAGKAPLLVVNADAVLLATASLARLRDAQRVTGARCALLTACVDDPHGLGRVLRNEDGRVAAVVEEKDGDEDVRSVREINVGAYALDGRWTWEALRAIEPSARTGERYLTELVGLAAASGSCAAVTLEDPREGLGINDRQELARAEEILRERVRRRWFAAGVSIEAPASVLIDADVEVGPDTTLLAGTVLRGRTRVGTGCAIGPYSVLVDSEVGPGCRIVQSWVEESTLAARVRVGPYSRVRGGSFVDEDSLLGNFAEVNRSRLGKRTRMHHFGYLGDAVLGDDVNVGAGTVTCNYDGREKHPTTVGHRVFIGSDTMLVAPVSLGDDAATAAGAVVTRDVLPGTLAVGVPARQRKRGTRRG